MTSLNKTSLPTTKEFMARAERYKNNPSGFKATILDHLDDIYRGKIDVVDPSNPFIFLLDSAAVGSTMAINESTNTLRRLYPSLATTMEDLYLHMSDVDLVDRFSRPSSTTFTVAVLVHDILNKMIFDESEGLHRATIARNSEFSLGDMVFTLQYPISIRKHPNNNILISYDTDIASPLQTLRTNVIDHYRRNDQEGVEWLFFDVEVDQIEIRSTMFPIQRSVILKERIAFKDKFYYARVHYKDNSTNDSWVEMLTTHTDQVFDPKTPTALLKVFGNVLSVEIPPIYVNERLLGGQIRVDVYQTKGRVDMDMGSFKVNAFNFKMKAIDEKLDITRYTNAMAKSISHYVYSSAMVAGGSDGLEIEELREKVIYDTLGKKKLPITNVELDSVYEKTGFDIVKNVDTLTNRIYLATQKLPTPSNAKLNTPANLGVSTFVLDDSTSLLHPYIRVNGEQITLLSNNLYQDNVGRLTLMTRDAIDDILSLSKEKLVDHVNSNKYLYTPFYYVIDSSNNELESRAYNLDHPTSHRLSFVDQNQSLQMPVNTAAYEFKKIDGGYKLFVVTTSSTFYRSTPDSMVNLQLAFRPEGEETHAYFSAELEQVTQGGERLYSVEFTTDYEITKDHRLVVTNAKMFNQSNVKVKLDLSQSFSMFYTTSSITQYFKPMAADKLFGKAFLPTASQVITHETIQLEFGSYLSNLWSRTRSLVSGKEYKRHQDNVYKVYDEDIYDSDPITGSIFTVGEDGELEYLLLHAKGDTVLDEHGEPEVLYPKGSTMLDEYGKPIVSEVFYLAKELDLLMVDGKNYFVDDLASALYRDEITTTLDHWITSEIKAIQSNLIEQTKIYFYPKTTLGKVKIYLEDNLEDYLESEQSLVLDLYVKPLIYNDMDVRANIEEQCTEVLDEHISGMVVNTTSIIKELSKLLDGTVETLDLYGLGGQKDYRILHLAAEHNRLCLKKRLELQQDNTIIVREDIKFNFHRLLD